MLAPQSSFMEKPENGIKNGVFREDLNIPETIISINMFCFFIFFKQIYYDSDYADGLRRQKEMELRREHVTEIILNYSKKRS